MNLWLQNKVVLITGGARGLGLEMAEAFYREGSKIVLLDINEEGINASARKLDPSGQRVLTCPADVTVEEKINSAVQGIMAHFGRIDVLINSAGLLKNGTIEEMSLADFELILKVNVTGIFIVCKAVVPVMKKQGGGKIINLASLGGRTGRPGVGVNYGASKAGVIGLTRTLAREVGLSGIYVNAIAPGPILTDMTKNMAQELRDRLNFGRAVDRAGMPKDVADSALFLGSCVSDWMNGVVLDVNGGILMR